MSNNYSRLVRKAPYEYNCCIRLDRSYVDWNTAWLPTGEVNISRKLKKEILDWITSNIGDEWTWRPNVDRGADIFLNHRDKLVEFKLRFSGTIIRDRNSLTS